ncbi:hypothetical protein MHH70_18310 [Metasolibacillus sp. FSL H7-0170]|uniref:hypothetical protein n=1 Tax=Metasolibacillus sp. FSL H7-0170 TaxID=2921431 RepID=UPI003157FEA1
MILYHYSNQDVEVLKPILGPTRHGGEDLKAVNKPVIWLTTSSEDIQDNQPKFRYTLDIDEKDERLFEDRPFNSTMKDMVNFGISSVVIKWFFYTSELKPQKKEVWNGENYV